MREIPIQANHTATPYPCPLPEWNRRL